MSDSDFSSASTHFARGRLLQTQHRLQDAIQSYKQALELDPEHTPSYVMLALCWLNDESTSANAVDAAERAVGLEPEDAFARGVLALTLNAKAKDGQTAMIKDALKHAEEAVGLDPDSDFAHAVTGRLHLRLRDYAKAEESARKALELDTESTMAAEVLSAALLMQKKDGDHKSLIEYQLQRDPNDDSAHTSAGWQALAEGDHKRANHHFMEALRLSPNSESARVGLVESFRARSAIYRLQLRFSHWMSQFTEGRQNMIMIGGFVAYRVVSTLLKGVSPLLSSLVIGAWLVFALWSHLARGFGSFFIVLDRFARQALRPREYWEGVVVGGLIFASLGSVIIGYALGVAESGYAALVFLLAAVANAAAFTNNHHLGRHVYAVAAGIAGFGALYVGTAIFSGINLPFAAELGVVALLTGVVISWLRPFRVLYA
ncbi:tetratricopeptide repeat protein [Prosthecobacter fusiformis]|uniref:Tetratricopeptide repeat protein n=1 Tax=Prosthecobacter fusiformis TaxID=48464 RepID=A0A4R7SP55_9BACT|nr:tetratricopeptide repeat protein [Prosthecobacter fusiformis]TDU80992.1 tetratricopeptide repeat protein [Prosthecobacter fusiformis]